MRLRQRRAALARLERLHRQRVVGVIRRRDVDDVHFRVCQHGCKIRRRRFEAELVSGRGCPPLIASYDELRDDLHRQIKEAVGLPVGVAVGAAHEGVSDHGYVEDGQLLLAAAIRLRS